MKRHAFFTGTVLTVIATGLAVITATSGVADSKIFQPDDTSQRLDVAAALTQFKKTWRTGEIDQVSILNIPTTIHFPYDLPSAALDSGYRFKLMVRNPKEQEVTQKLVSVVEKLEVHPSTQQPDVRWGFVFESTTGDRIFSVYADSEGKRGVINGTCVSFDNKELVQWAESQFGRIFD